MLARWTIKEERLKKQELAGLYTKENKTIGEIALILNLSASTVYDRLIRLGIPIIRTRKEKYNNKRTDILILNKYSAELAEFIGIMLGDGNLTPTQVTVTLGKKDKYIEHVSNLMQRLFGPKPKVSFSKQGDCAIYLGSTMLVRWLLSMGLVFNKVKAQVDIPRWILSRNNFISAGLRGLFDTDGSVYALRWEMQISFCNRSRPLIESVGLMLKKLGLHPSRISGYNLYLTRRTDIDKFFKEIGFGNCKHQERFRKFYNSQYGCVA